MELKDWLNSINLNKTDLIEEDPSLAKEYPPFIINKCMSGHLDTVLYANEMNMAHFLDKKLQYDFYLNSVRKRKRFSPWLRKDKVKDLDVVKSYYGYSATSCINRVSITSFTSRNCLPLMVRRPILP
jgi:hypothetical protein